MSDAFISYARKDAHIVDQLVDELIAAGVNPWIDRVGIPAGKMAFLEIQKELEAAPCVLGCWTENGRLSGHVLDECKFATENAKLIPVLLQQVQPPWGYGTMRHYDLTGWIKDRSERDELDRVIADIKSRRRPRNVSAPTVTSTDGFKIRETYAPDFDRQFAKAASALLDELSWIDQEYQFQKDWFTPLNADVEVHKGGGLDDRKIADLLDAITTDRKSPMFLVVGDPGAGKSVAMRELARHGLRLASASKAKSLSIYVNLREWATAQKWTQDNPPDTLALEAFLEKHLAAYDNAFLRDFFREYLGRLHTDGRIFWIFDSFDEIPAVLDAGAGIEAKWIIDRLSSVLWRFIRQGSRGVISSRPTRRPELPADLATQLVVRPFDEDKIDTALKKVDAFPGRLIPTLLSARPDLLPLARTPFYLGLIAEFGARQRRLPNTQVELFEAYILNRLGSDALRVKDVNNGAVVQAIRASEDMAYFLLTSPHGLEAPLDVIGAQFPGVDIAASIARLTQARIMRMGRAPALFCSFAHRRIQEYFVIRHMVRMHAPFDHEWVAADSSMRDAAVLYVELASDQEAEQIAGRCWQEIAAQPPNAIDYAKPAFWRALHCQRFLVEAFRARLPALDAFRADMAARVHAVLDAPQPKEEDYDEDCEEDDDTVSKTRDLVTMKLAVETVGLLPEDAIPEVLGAALQNGDSWVRESAINASRFLPNVRPDLAGRIWRSVAAMPVDEFRREHKRLSYAFQLAAALSGIGRLIRLRARDDREWRWIGRWIASGFLFWRLLPVFVWRELMLRHPTDELTALATAKGRELADLEQDKSSGLSGYRKVLASTNFDWISNLGLRKAPGFWYVISVVMFLPIGSVAFNLLEARLRGFGPDYTLAAIIDPLQSHSFFFILLMFIGASIWISPFFSNRSYSLVVTEEEVPPPTISIALLSRAVIIVVAMMIVFIMFIPKISPYLDLYLSPRSLIVRLMPVTIFIILMIVLSGVLFVSGAGWRRRREALAADRERFDVFTNGDNSTRFLIADHFLAFQTGEVREKFVRWLGAQRLEPTDDWPEGRPPNCGDNASSLLARLEHHWRKLDG